jgi:hypothetical protein
LAGEGILYVGLRERRYLEPKLERYYRMVENGIKVFVFSQEDWQGWDSPEITPVVAEDLALSEYAFMGYPPVTGWWVGKGEKRRYAASSPSAIPW